MIKNGLTPRFAEIGKIKIGGKGETRPTKDGKGTYQLPVRFEHFVITTTEKGPDGNFITNHDIMKKLGQEPKELSIRLPFDSIDMNFYTSYQYYAGKKCTCHGDGEKATRTDKEGNERQVNCNLDKCEFLQSEKCKPSGILSCHLPITMEIGGIYRFRTHSWNSVSSILAALKYFSENTNGVLQGLPLKLKFIKKSTAEHGNVSIVTVVLDGIEMMKLREVAYAEYENRLKMGIDMKLIENQAKSTGFLIDKDDPEDVEAEWYAKPEPVKTESKIKSTEYIIEDLKTGKKETETETVDVQGDLL